MDQAEPAALPLTITVGAAEAPLLLYLAMANRHGLIAGATGTGKTVTLQVLAEGFSRAGVPVFCADIKGDLSGISQAGAPNPKLDQRAAALGITDYAHQASPTIFWDVFAAEGHPVRATIAEMGPVLLARILELNDTQAGVLGIVFALADSEGLLLLDLKDLRAMLAHVSTRTAELSASYGNVTKASLGTIQRKLLTLDQDGATAFFGEPAFALSDLMRKSPDGRGAISVLAADKLVQSPRLYATFLLWLMSDLFEQLPEVGDIDRPKLVFFFDEAHLLFRDAPKSLVDKVEQVVRLIRSKGVGIYFVTQNPTDIPPAVLGQLGNRVQHALRAFTPADQKAVRGAADTFRPNPKLDTATVITELAVGEALISTLDPGGIPSMVQRGRICPPRGRIGAVTAEERRASMAASPVAGVYDTMVDRQSAYEMLNTRAGAPPLAEVAAAPQRLDSPWGRPPDAPAAQPAASWSGAPVDWNNRGSVPAVAPAPAAAQDGGLLSEILGGSGRRQGVVEALAKTVVRGVGSQVGTQIGRAVVRGLFGSIRR